MKKNTIAIIAVSLAALLLAGCIQPVQKIGCCLRENATQGDEDERGCVLYNISDFKIYDLIGDTIGPCDDESRNLTGHCLVDLGGDEDTAIPICTEDDLGTCFEPDCLAMVCGDFKYSPRVAPGFSNVDEMEGRTPPETEGENTRNFYEAQCRFLPMDTRLRSTMKNSNSLINVFRIGIGETFAEYDQYRYYFPMSDKYCSLDVNLEGDAGMGDEGDKVDRYMNYIGEGMAAFDPIDMTEDCLDDSEEIPPPFQFGFGSYSDTTGLGTAPYEYDITDPDMSGYLFKEYARYVIPARPDGRFDEDDVEKNMQFKQIDDGYYREALVTAYYDNIFGAGFARAPFECDSGGFDCYSGECDTSAYNRGVFMLGEPGADEESWDPVAANCNEETDALGKKLVSCLPVKGVFKSGGNVDVDYAPVNVVPWLVRVELDGYAGHDLTEDDANPPDTPNGCCGEDWCTPHGDEDWGTTHVCGLRWEWMDVTGNCWFNEGDCHARWAPSGTAYDNAADVYAGLFSIDKLPEDFGYERHDVENEAECDAYGGNCVYNEGGDGRCYCPYLTEDNEYPPAAKVELFGTFGDNDYENVVWHDNFDGRDKTVLGYAAVADGQFDKLSIVRQCGIGPEDYVMVILGDPASPDDYRTSTNSFTRLQWAFRPYLNHRIEVLANTQWQDSDRMLDGDIIFSSMPWVVAYKRGSYDGNTFNTETKHYTEPINYYMERNYLDEPVPYDYFGVSSDELRFAYAGGDYKNYVMLTTERIYLFTDGNEDGKLGDCVLDGTTGLPVVETYGWCKPCTASTLAYQWMTANETTYIPYADVDLEGMGGKIICDPDASVDCSTGTCITTYGMTCSHTQISDIDVYNGEAIPRGSPRTIPEASYMKQKLELFMKSGIMPVLDFSDKSNWNLSYMAGSGAPGGMYEGIPETYEDYDLRYLLNDRGSMIIIVDTVARFIGTEPVEPQRIAERANIVRQACPRCLTAVAVRTADNDTLDEVLGDVFSDPRNSLVIDMVAIDYSPNWKEPGGTFYQSDDAVNRSLEVVDDMASYAQVSLVGYGKPAIITKFDVSEWISEANGGVWNEDTFETLFSTVVVNQDKLLRAGIIGVIFSPARSEYGISDSGVVDDYSGVGEKTAKFCALERAANKMSDVPTTAMFTPMMLQYNVQCINCTELEMARGLCMDAAMTDCDNGAICKHEFEDRNSVKCPENTITQLTSAHPCDVCSERGGTYVCDYTYVDGTVVQEEYDSGEIVSDAYAEVMAGTPRPDKCCLQTESGDYYSYAKIDMKTPVVRPVVFSKSGNPEQDCGMSTTMQASELSFCGFEMPLKDYDINCTFVPG